MSTARNTIGIDELRQRCARVPRVGLGHFPTPLEPLERFSRALGGPPIWIKRDDCTGLALGGNKTRHNEFIFGHARQVGADAVVWGAGVQSNNCRQTAAACAKLGLDCHLVLSRADFREEVQGNLLLDHLLGASIEVVDAPIGPPLDGLIARRAAELAARGRQVYFWNPRVCKPRATISYVLCLAEIAEQMAAQGEQATAVYVSSAGSTGAGLALGRALLGADVAIRMIAPLRWPWDMAEDLAATANAAAELVGLSARVSPDEIDVSDDWIGPGYGIPSAEGMEATRLLARTEGILVDPIYTAKALAALIEDVRRGRFNGRDRLVFVHTGGVPALFAYRDELVAGIPPGRLE